MFLLATDFALEQLIYLENGLAHLIGQVQESNELILVIRTLKVLNRGAWLADEREPRSGFLKPITKTCSSLYFFIGFCGKLPILTIFDNSSQTCPCSMKIYNNSILSREFWAKKPTIRSSTYPYLQMLCVPSGGF